MVEVLGIFKENTDISTSFISDFLRIDDILRAFEYSEIVQFLNTLMYRSPAHIAFACNFEKWHAGILCQQTDNLLIQ